MVGRGSRGGVAATAVAMALVEALQPLGAVSARRMFGGHGVFEGAVMFALVDRAGDAYLRADDALAAALEAEGPSRFQRMPYRSLPAEAIEDETQLRSWAERALAVARAARR